MARKTVPMTAEHRQRALELKQQGYRNAEIVRALKKEFALPYAHNRQTVANHLTKYGGHLKDGNGGNGGRRGTTKALEVTVPAYQVDMEPVTLAWDPTQTALYKTICQARVAQQLAIKVQHLEDELAKVSAENQRLKGMSQARQRFELAQQQGEVGKLNLTEQLLCLPLLAVSCPRIMPTCLDITSAVASAVPPLLYIN